LLARLLQQVCAALHHAHEQADAQGWLGFIHRGVCPDNVMVSAGGTAKVLDFGAARMRGVADAGAPQVLRTRYVAPERVQGLSEDRRADVYAVGVMLYEQATGATPFAGNDLEMISQIVGGRSRDVREVEPEVPEAMAQIIRRAMALAPGDRYPTAHVLGLELAAFAEASADRAELDAALEVALRNLFHTPAQSEEPWESQPMPLPRPPAEEAAPTSSSRERFAPDADFSNDDITRPTSTMPEELGAPELVVEAEMPASESWLTGRQEALSKAPPDVFGASRAAGGDEGAKEEASPGHGFAAPRLGPTTNVPDVFALYGRERAAPSPVTEPARQPRSSSPAAQRFDRGLELLGAKLHALALPEWEAACRLEPENRLYQTNLRRLREQIASGRGRSKTTESE
jgi:serine/threonine protein kinase